MNIIQIVNSLIWAALILTSSFLLKGTQHKEMIFYTLLIGASLQISLMGHISRKYLGKRSCEPQTA